MSESTAIIAIGTAVPSRALTQRIAGDAVLQALSAEAALQEAR
jgi:hypothetical protein